MTRRTTMSALAAGAAFAQNGKVTHKAAGKFDVKLTPADMDGDRLGRMRIDKQFHGGLQAKSLGQMLSAMTDVKGSAVYVALERVEGSLDGRAGSFVLHHRGIMDRGTPALAIEVAPDSGTDGLAGLSGTMTIQNDKGDHSYEFVYSLPAR